jgi:hypothetical protein
MATALRGDMALRGLLLGNGDSDSEQLDIDTILNHYGLDADTVIENALSRVGRVNAAIDGLPEYGWQARARAKKKIQVGVSGGIQN